MVFAIVGSAIVLAGLGAAVIVNVHAGPSAQGSGTPGLTTNWVGYLVSGEYRRDLLIDPMPGSGPFSRIVPEANPHLEIGLRSDGIVVWRTVPKTK